MPTPTPANPFRNENRNGFADKGPMIDIKLPYFLSHTRKVLEEKGGLSSIVNSRQWAKRSVGIHTDPLFLGELLLQHFSVALQLLAIKAGHSGKQSRHECRQEKPSENSSQQHDLNVIIYRAAVI